MKGEIIKMQPLISVIIPIYKVEDYLKQCIDSVINQSYKHLEIILVDDGSPDNCGKICDEYANKDKRIKVIYKENGGLSDARNAGINVAKGDYIAFVDSDDWIHQEMCEKLITIAIEEEADIVECKFKSVYKREYMDEDNINQKVKVFNNIEALKNHFYGQDLYRCVWNKIYKRELFNNIRFPKGIEAEDLHTTYKLFYKAKKIAFTEYIGYYYYIRKDSIMGKADISLIISVFEGMKEQQSFIAKNIPILKRRVDNLYMNCLLKTIVCLDKKNIPNNYVNYKNIVLNEIKRKDISTYGITKVLVISYKIFPNLIKKIINQISNKKR